jgi:hypothetical protein
MSSSPAGMRTQRECGWRSHRIERPRLAGTSCNVPGGPALYFQPHGHDLTGRPRASSACPTSLQNSDGETHNPDRARRAPSGSCVKLFVLARGSLYEPSVGG